MSKITKMPLQATTPTGHNYQNTPNNNILPTYPQTSLSSYYPQNRQLPNCPQFRLHELTTLSEITKLSSDRKITEMSLTS